MLKFEQGITGVKGKSEKRKRNGKKVTKGKKEIRQRKKEKEGTNKKRIETKKVDERERKLLSTMGY